MGDNLDPSVHSIFSPNTYQSNLVILSSTISIVLASHVAAQRTYVVLDKSALLGEDTIVVWSGGPREIDENF